MRCCYVILRSAVGAMCRKPQLVTYETNMGEKLSDERFLNIITTYVLERSTCYTKINFDFLLLSTNFIFEIEDNHGLRRFGR